MVEQRSRSEYLSKKFSSKRGFKPPPHTHLCPLFGNKNCRCVGAPGNFSAMQIF